MINKYVVIFLLSIFIASCAQIILKTSADIKHENFLKEYLNIRVLGAYMIFFASTILTIIAYRGVELKKGPILESVGYIFVLALSGIFLNEKITLNKLIGTMMVIGGIFLFCR
ncbi:MAG: EamA family transporter [Syntrophomonadaceae bacterium]|nr:EamA family transporter [Syntrophomonadaceae bacterium]